MQLSQIIDALRNDLTAVASLGDEQTAAVAQRIVVALEGSLAIRLVDAFSFAAVELSAQIPSGHVEVRLAGRDPQLVFVEEPERAAEPIDDDTSARITLRLPESLKNQIEVAAAASGASVNTWVIRTLARAVSQPTQRGRNRLTGYAKS